MSVSERMQKPRRRSSFVPGRISNFHVTSKDMYLDIDASLSVEDRLMELTRNCFTYALSKVAIEIPSVQNEEVWNEAMNAMTEKIKEMKEKELFYELCHKERNNPNPINIEMDKVSRDLELHIKRLREEADCWEQLQKQSEDMRKSEEEADQNEIEDDNMPPDIVKLSENYLGKHLDYRSICGDADRAVLKTDAAISKITINSLLLSEAGNVVNSNLQQMMTDFSKISEDTGRTPRKLLRAMAADSTPGVRKK